MTAFVAACAPRTAVVCLVAAALLMTSCDPPPTKEEVVGLIMKYDRRGLVGPTSVLDVSIGEDDAPRCWKVQATVQYLGLFPSRNMYRVYKDTDGNWAIERRERN